MGHAKCKAPPWHPSKGVKESAIFEFEGEIWSVTKEVVFGAITLDELIQKHLNLTENVQSFVHLTGPPSTQYQKWRMYTSD